MPAFNLRLQRFPRSENVILSDVFLKRLGPHAIGQRTVFWPFSRFGRQGRRVKQAHGTFLRCCAKNNAIEHAIAAFNDSTFLVGIRTACAFADITDDTPAPSLPTTNAHLSRRSTSATLVVAEAASAYSVMSTACMSAINSAGVTVSR